MVPKQKLKALYLYFVPSHILYGILTWGCTNESTLSPLRRNLRKAVRVIDFVTTGLKVNSFLDIYKYLALIDFTCLKELRYCLKVTNAQISFHYNMNSQRQKTYIGMTQSSSESFSLLLVSTNLQKMFLTFEGVKV